MSDASDVENVPLASPSHFLPIASPSHLLPIASPSHLLPIASPSHFLPKRSRTVYHEDSNPSSDPPLFSSDPLDASAENYVQKPRKRQYHGTWWGQRAKRQHLAGRTFVRNLDSGVWMGSDSSDDTLPDASTNSSAPQAVSLQLSRCRQSVQSSLTPAAIHAYRVVQDSVERDKEYVDLSDLELEAIPHDLLSPLRLVTKQASFLCQNTAPDDDDCESLRPLLQLFLQKNLLRSLPAELWNLENLTVLSLRHNKLTYIPPSIARLQHLRELNIACNRLRYLPWELLTLIGGDGDLNTNGPLRSVTILPNPLFRALRITQNSAEAYVIPADGGKNMDKAQNFREIMQSTSDAAASKEAAWFAKLHQSYADILHRQDESKPGSSHVSWNTVKPIYMSSTPVIYFDVDGSPLDSNSFPAPSRIPHTNHALLFTLPLDEGRRITKPSASRVHSLFELATLRAQNASTLPLLPEDTPSTVFNALQTATTIREEEGERRCSVCNRSYIIPRTEWVEFWHRVPVHVLAPERLTASGLDELFLPFLRRGCSWGCVARLQPLT